MTTNLWFEKYRPKRLEDIVLPPAKVQLVRRWFQDFKDGKSTSGGLLLTGPPGLGKTSLAHIILHTNGYKVKEFNASDTRSKSLIHESLYGLINITDVNRIVNRGELPVGIIMDEVDGMFKSDRGGVDELLSFITSQQRVPIICICNLGNVKKDTIKQLQKDCLEIAFTLPDAKALKEVSVRVIKGENMTVDDEALEIIIECAQQDFRRLVGILEFLHACSRGKG